MKTIYKYQLVPSGKKIIDVEMPHQAKILTTAGIGDEIFIWAEVETEFSTTKEHFEVFGTGHKINEDMGINREYIGTAFLYGGSLVLHVYHRID